MRDEPLRNGRGEALCGAVRSTGAGDCLCGHDGGADWEVLKVVGGIEAIFEVLSKCRRLCD